MQEMTKAPLYLSTECMWSEGGMGVKLVNMVNVVHKEWKYTTAIFL